jgi:protein-tyrosine-phosphatase
MSRFSPGETKRPPTPPAIPRKRVLFVCLGNICRSPMAEALARKYGSDILMADSAGLTPAIVTTPLTRSVLAQRNVDLGNHLPKSLNEVDLTRCDLIVNMSGMKLPSGIRVPVEEWPVPDPYGAPEPAYRKACDDIEGRVMRLILRARTGKL